MDESELTTTAIRLKDSSVRNMNGLETSRRITRAIIAHLNLPVR